ncbi:glycosyltransferase family 25 protein [Rhodobacteraceae bacterium B1Z28]|uniref:Glycosyltransferase family 25 protein n=1 Tax=Ruegeria haliotis TaxID=2747601 RepID=A0ABX2PSK6_9RHOB|nr:glycosyltransferase family 25 protein [Ruegeria haliotis]NVO56177.1 glycosyltransferase family 25 protein [Ruegeria haliotis]
MRSFIIHMSSSTARRPNAEKLCNDLPNAELFEAVNGRDPDQIADVSMHLGTLHRPYYPFALRPAEIGVFQSHRRIWRKMVDENIDLAIITEDDLRIDPDRMQQVLDMLQPIATPDHYIRIPVKQREIPAQTLAEQDGLRLILPWIVGLQCVCQMVGRRAAERLLAATDHIDRPVDTFLQMHWLTGQPIHALLGSGNQEVAREIGGSTIQMRPPLSDKMTREFKRAAYRTKLYFYPQRPPVSFDTDCPQGASRPQE